MKKINLASPYSGTPEQEAERFRDVCIAAGEIKKRFCVFSPIAHTRYIAFFGNLPESHEYWKEHNRSWLEWSDELWVLKLPGWDKSVGVKSDELWVLKLPGWDKSVGVKWATQWAMQNGRRIFTIPFKVGITWPVGVGITWPVGAGITWPVGVGITWPVGAETTPPLE